MTHRKAFRDGTRAPRSSRGRERKADRHEGRDPTYPCFVAASTMAATVMPATPLCASSTYALFLMVPASYPSAVASALHAIRRFLFAAPLAPASVPSEPLLSPGFAPFRPGVPPELVVAGVVGAPGGAFAAAVALFSSSSTRRRLLVAIYGGRWFAKSLENAKSETVFTPVADSEENSLKFSTENSQAPRLAVTGLGASRRPRARGWGVRGAFGLRGSAPPGG